MVLAEPAPRPGPLGEAATEPQHAIAATNKIHPIRIARARIVEISQAEDASGQILRHDTKATAETRIGLHGQQVLQKLRRLQHQLRPTTEAVVVRLTAHRAHTGVCENIITMTEIGKETTRIGTVIETEIGEQEHEALTAHALVRRPTMALRPTGAAT